MPEMPNVDTAGLLELFSIILVALGVFWGINKAIQIAKNG